MEARNIIVGLDVATTKVCTLIGELVSQGSDSSLEILGLGTEVGQGIKKGDIVSIDKTAQAILNSIKQAELMAGVKVSKVTASISGRHIQSFNNSGVVAVSGAEVNSIDIDRAMESANAIVCPPDRTILHTIAQDFKVDGMSGIKNPLGMRATRLEVNVHIVTASINAIQNLRKAIKSAGLECEQIVLSSLASSSAVLSPEEKEMGVLLLDIGGGTTDMALFKEGALIHSQIIPIGGMHFTNDLALTLKISQSEAERIKLEHANLIEEEQDFDPFYVKVQGPEGQRPKEIELKLITEVLSARALELFSIIKAILKEKDLFGNISSGIVLSGAGPLMKGFCQFAGQEFSLPVTIARINPFDGLSAAMKNPKYASVIGLCQKAKDYYTENPNLLSAHGVRPELFSKVSHTFKSMFKEIF